MFKSKGLIPNHQFYYFESCPFCIKTRFALWRMGIKLKKKDILRNSNYKDQLITGGGKKQVPCLRIEKDNQVVWLYESSDIINYFRQGLHLE